MVRIALSQLRLFLVLILVWSCGGSARAQVCASYGVDDALLAEVSWPEGSGDIAVGDGIVFSTAFHNGGAYPGDYPYGVYRVHDLTDPASPVFLRTLPWSDAGGRIGVYGNHVYTASGTADWTTGQEVGTFSLSGYFCTEVLTVGATLWVVHTSGVDVFDLANPVGPVSVALLQAGENCRVAASADNLVHVVTASGLTVWDASDPLVPVQRGFLPMSGTPRAVTAAGATVVVSYGTLLQSIDVSDPDTPTLAASVTPPLQIKQLAARGTMVYATNFLGWLEAWDFSVPSAPYRSGYVQTAGSSGEIGLLDSAVVTVRPTGLRTFRRDCLDPGAPGASAVETPSAKSSLAIAPNPFNPSTVIRFEVGTRGPVAVMVSDVRGAHVATLYSGVADPGSYRVTWNGRDEFGRRAASGVYFVQKSEAGRLETVPITLLK